MLFALKVIQKVREIVATFLPDPNLHNIDYHNINKPINEYNVTWLHLFSFYGKSQVVQELLDNGEKTNSLDKYGHTALHYAVIGGDLKTTELLIEHSVKIGAASKFGDTAIHYVSLFSNSILMPTLISHNARLNVANRDDLTPLHYAIIANNPEAESVILQAGYNVTASNYKSLDVFYLASMLQNKNLTKNLLSHFEYNDLATHSQQMLNLKPIHFAKLAKNCGVITLLKGEGAKDAEFTAPTFYERSMKEICNGEAIKEVAKYTGANLFSGHYCSAGLVSQFACIMMFVQIFKGINNLLISPILNHLVTNIHSFYEGTDTFLSDFGSSLEQQICGNIYYERILHPKMIASFKQAVGYLEPWEAGHKRSWEGDHQKEYLVPSDSCKNQSDSAIAHFYDLGVDWTLCITNDIHQIQCH